ncbi:hypothetical protein, partial [Klebsiella michiganensis]|uniref:hypothetical protein n=1 Tax=Klebsiella michiganensis TaxID=1134687 RepID=UPI001E2AC118
LEAQSVKDKPSLIICRTVIGFGSPNKAGKEEAHGAALGEQEVEAAIKTARENNVVLFEAFKTASLPNFQLLKQSFDKIGKL